MTITKTAAIREAASHVHIWGGDTNWTIVGPYAELDGPSTEMGVSNYAMAVAVRTRWVARIALDLMGVIDDDFRAICMQQSHQTTVRGLVSDVARRAQEA